MHATMIFFCVRQDRERRKRGAIVVSLQATHCRQASIPSVGIPVEVSYVGWLTCAAGGAAHIVVCAAEQPTWPRTLRQIQCFFAVHDFRLL